MQSNYQTKDLISATVLYARKHTLLSTFWEDHVCYFIFEDELACGKDITRFYQGKLLIDAKKIFDAQKTLKNLIFGSPK